VDPRVTFSVILPTTGRPTLRYAFESAASQLAPGDEVIVIRDESDDWGDSPRNSAMDRASGTHLIFLDDDDEFLPGALATMRRFAQEHPGRIGIFRQRRVQYGRDGEIRRVGVTWHDRDVSQTAPPLYCVPNIPGKVGRFRAPAEEPRRGNVAFIRETIALQGEPVWREECTSVVKPERSRWRRLKYLIAVRTRLRRLLRHLARSETGSRSASKERGL
jgi:glycosyltransferase involved in cell wall biosynthesis